MSDKVNIWVEPEVKSALMKRKYELHLKTANDVLRKLLNLPPQNEPSNQ